MYDDSTAYRNAVRSSAKMTLSGSIVTTDGVSHTIDDSVISNGEVSIAMGAVSGDALEFGGAVLGELNISLRTNLSRYMYYGAEISLNCSVQTSSTSSITIPMGIWTVAEAERDKASIKLTAYDNLIKLNVPFTVATEGSPYALMSATALACGCELAENRDYYDALPNGTEHISINETSGSLTYRGVASIVAQMCGCYVQADRDGKISMRQLQYTPTLDIQKSDRYSSSISDWITSYNALSVTGNAGTFYSEDAELEDRMTFVIDDSPAWDFGLAETLQQRADNLLASLVNYEYTPCEMELLSDPGLDCGDCFTVHTDEGNIVTIVTSYEWNYHGKTKVTSVGTNPFKADSQSSAGRQSRETKREVAGAQIIYYPFTNIDRINLSVSPKQIASVIFTTTQETSIVFNGTFQIYATVSDVEERETIRVETPAILTQQDVVVSGQTIHNYTFGTSYIPYNVTHTKRGFGRLQIFYMYDNESLGTTYYEDMTNGAHIITLYHPINRVEANTTHTFSVWVSMSGGSAKINENEFIGSISGQGLAVTARWNGQLQIEQSISRIDLSDVFTIKTLSDTMNVNTDAEVESAPFTETLSKITFSAVTIKGLSSNITIGESE